MPVPGVRARGKPAETDVVRWRTLDVHGKRAFLESGLPRIICGGHGKITAAVPWARHDDRFSRPFEEFAAWKAAHMPWTRAAAELRITWEALANITARVAADASAGLDRLDGLRRIGIDEKSWGKGQGKYLVIVTDHDTGRVAWIGEGRCQATVKAFFDDLGAGAGEALTHVSADGAEWIHPVVRARSAAGAAVPGCVPRRQMGRGEAGRTAPPHRRGTARRRARRRGRHPRLRHVGAAQRPAEADPGPARRPRPDRRGEQAAVQGVPDQGADPRGVQGQGRGRQVAHARGDRLGAPVPHPQFARLAKTLSRYKAPIEATLDGGPSNGRAEALNSQVGALITRARGFRAPPP